MTYGNYERFIEEYLNKGLLKRQKSNYHTAEKLILCSRQTDVSAVRKFCRV
ncbi:unnamed protein product [marine sediment metagenome]|uniref:Uncharacterized protein n=1 Tax=marine sediment metagenome TaxID=412755 RepID=X1FZU4_9ZZZZ